MKRGCLWVAVLGLLLVFGLCVPYVLAAERGSGDAAVHFVEVLATGDWKWASNLCTDPKGHSGLVAALCDKIPRFPLHQRY